MNIKTANNAATRTALSLFKIVQFVFYRIPTKDKGKYYSQLRNKIFKTNPIELSKRQLKPNSSVNNSVSFIKNMLTGINTEFTMQVLSELVRLLGDAPALKRAFLDVGIEKTAKFIKKRKEKSGNITYIYSEKHIEKRNKLKMKRLKRLYKSLGKLRKQVKKDLSNEDTKTRAIALAIALIDETYSRVGNINSAKELGHYGVTTWLVKHIKFSGKSATVSFVGKSGVKQVRKIKDSKVVTLLKEFCKGKAKNDKVFDGDDYYVNDNYVNIYLRPFDITAKDIRGLHANEEMKKALSKVRKSKLPTDKKEREKQLKSEFKEALEIAAENIGHEPGTLKNQYLIPTIEPSYLKNGKITALSAQEYRILKIAANNEYDLWMKINKIGANLKPVPATPDVVIEPLDPIIQKAVRKIRSIEPNIFMNVTKIIVHQGGGSGQLGHVESGPGKDPREIHIFKSRIEELVKKGLGNVNKNELEEAIEKAIMETISHEVGHIGKSRTQEQILQQQFLGESEAERIAKEFTSKASLDAFEVEEDENEEDDLEQDCISPTPSDKPFDSLIEGYEPWHSMIGSNPYGIFTVPIGLGGGSWK